MKNEHKRVKHGHVPGDIHKANKIAMRERRTPIFISAWQTISTKAAKVYRKMLRKKGKKRQRRRDQERIEEGIESQHEPENSV